MSLLAHTKTWWYPAFRACLGEESAWPEMAHPDPVAWVAALEDRYGPLSGRGLAVRLGQALFWYLPGLPTLERSPARRRERVLHGLTWLGNEGGAPLGLQAQAQTTPTGWQWHVLAPQGEPSPCPLWLGLLQEALYWLGGAIFRVDEIACRRRGAATCRFHIPYQPLR